MRSMREIRSMKRQQGAVLVVSLLLLLVMTYMEIGRASCRERV